MQTFDTPSEFDAAGMIAYLTSHGYRVSKARRKAAAWEDRTEACVHCGSREALHVTSIGTRKAKTLRDVAVCDDCYRYGPWLHATPYVPADPARHDRLFRAWRHAQHRYSGTIRYDYSDPYSAQYHAHPRLVAITKALHNEPRVRRETRGEVAA
jgi:hypothetical protein